MWSAVENMNADNRVERKDLEAVDILSGDLAGRVRQCGADDCYLAFLDTSRPGNRTKVCGYRTRQTDF